MTNTTNIAAVQKKVGQLAAQVALPTVDFKARVLRSKRLAKLAELKTELAKLEGRNAFYGTAFRPDGTETIVCIPGRD